MNDNPYASPKSTTTAPVMRKVGFPPAVVGMLLIYTAGTFTGWCHYEANPWMSMFSPIAVVVGGALMGYACRLERNQALQHKEIPGVPTP